MQSPGKALLRTSGPFWPFFACPGLSEQGLPLDTWAKGDPPNFIDARILYEDRGVT